MGCGRVKRNHHHQCDTVVQPPYCVQGDVGDARGLITRDARASFHSMQNDTTARADHCKDAVCRRPRIGGLAVVTASQRCGVHTLWNRTSLVRRWRQTVQAMQRNPVTAATAQITCVTQHVYCTMQWTSLVMTMRRNNVVMRTTIVISWVLRRPFRDSERTSTRILQTLGSLRSKMISDPLGVR